MGLPIIGHVIYIQQDIKGKNMYEQKKLIPAIFTDGDMKCLAEVLMSMLAEDTGCISGGSGCRDLTVNECTDRCILNEGVSDGSFVTEPVQWLIDKKLITKGQALDLTLLIS